ncbi:hypothetical protein M2373_002211 [Chryseobacterium sp. JUb7]|nr:hypothetical protein [Chryseobacterium sp. JUb7]
MNIHCDHSACFFEKLLQEAYFCYRSYYDEKSFLDLFSGVFYVYLFSKDELQGL